MKLLSALLVLCEGIPQSPMDSPHKGPVMQSFCISFDVRLKLLNKHSSCHLFQAPWCWYDNPCNVQKMWFKSMLHLSGLWVHFQIDLDISQPNSVFTIINLKMIANPYFMTVCYIALHHMLCLTPLCRSQYIISDLISPWWLLMLSGWLAYIFSSHWVSVRYNMGSLGFWSWSNVCDGSNGLLPVDMYIYDLDSLYTISHFDSLVQDYSISSVFTRAILSLPLSHRFSDFV